MPMTADQPSNQHLPQQVDATEVDGVICFGGVDWWYHNRGHYDLQIMREFSGRLPVMYVNSLGMRMPRMTEGSMFFKRVHRKWKSFRRGLVEVRPNFHVFSPTALPGKVGMTMSKRFLIYQLHKAAKKLGMKNPLIWVACPPGVEVVDDLQHAGMVYQRTDRFESFKNVDPELIKSFDKRLKRDSDMTVYCSTSLFEEERDDCKYASFIDHGVDYTPFSEAGRDPSSEPDDVKEIARPRVGFVGGVDIHTFDPPLFETVVKLLPDVQFIVVGGTTLDEPWFDLPNVHMMGQRLYEEVPGYMAANDVLIMPWNKSEWIKACNPIKLKEYLAVGRPVVTTWFDELVNYDGYVTVAKEADDFAQAIRDALAAQTDADHLRQRVETETWSAKADLAVEELSKRGLQFPEKK